jgi:hypothetical protein
VTLNGAAGNLEQWEALCTTLGVDTSLNRSTAGAQLEMRFRTRTAVSWSYHLDDAGVPNEIAVTPRVATSRSMPTTSASGSSPTTST